MLLHISRDHPTPIPAQIAAGIRDAVATGALSPNDAIPSTRALAEQLGVSRGSVVTAYDQLEGCLLYTSPSPRDQRGSRMPSSA